jgi:type III secretion system TyeA family effector delivery regulator
MSKLNTNRVAGPQHAKGPGVADAAQDIAGSYGGEGATLADVDDAYFAKTRRETEVGMRSLHDANLRTTQRRSAGAATFGVERKPLSGRKMRLDPPIKPMRARDIAQAQRLSGSTMVSRQLALRLLRRGQWPPRQSGRRGVVQSYLALQSVASYLDEDGDEDEAVGLLTPAQGWPGGTQELAKRLQEAGEDAHALAEVLEEVEGLQGERPEVLYDMLKNTRYDTPELAKLLRKAQGFPPDKKALRQLRQQVHDALREMERTDGGLIRATLNAGDAAKDAPEPEVILDTYGELVNGSDDFSGSASKLLERFQAGNLRNGIELMLKALGDDLSGLVAQPTASDTVHLEAIVKEIWKLQTLLTMTEWMQERFPPNLDQTVLLRGLLGIVGGRWVAPAQFEGLARDLGVTDDKQTIRVLTGFRALFSELPVKAFQSDDGRRAVLTAAQDALDAAIEREEAMDDEVDHAEPQGH